MKKILLATLVALIGLAGVLSFAGCQSHEKTLKVAATPVPHADLLEAIKPDLEQEGVNLKIVEVDDYNLPNRLLYEKQVDANFFQHKPFLDEQNQRFGYNLKPLVAVHIEPLGIYSQKIKSLDQLKEGATVAIPSDPTNEVRALSLLQEVGVIKLKALKGQFATVHDIEENPKNLKIEEVDAAFLPRALADVDLAVIPANFALQAHLNPTKDALALETSESPYANIVVIREGEENREDLQKLKAALTSEKMRAHILEKYKGAIAPAF
jgi:D-methionine transport system substrate-binding protein